MNYTCKTAQISLTHLTTACFAYCRSSATFYKCQNRRVLHYAWHNSARVCLCLCGFVCFCGFWLIQTHYAQISCLDGWILLCLTGLDAVRVGSPATLPFMQQAFAHCCLCGRWKKPAINTDLRPALRFLTQCLVWSEDLSATAGPRSVQRSYICSEILRVTHRKSLRYALQSNVCLLSFL